MLRSEREKWGFRASDDKQAGFRREMEQWRGDACGVEELDATSVKASSYSK